MSKILKRIGQVTYPSGQKQWKVLALCDCGVEFETIETSFHSGRNPSCGCKLRRRTNRKYGREIQSRWQGILGRVCNSNFDRSKTKVSKCYENVKICDEWLNDQDKFYEWAIANGFNPKLHIDRIDPNKGYSPDNCRWITQKENNRNGARSKISKKVVIEILRLHGEYSSLDIAKTFNMDSSTICNIAKGRLWNDIWKEHHTDKNIKRVNPTKVKDLPNDYTFYDKSTNITYAKDSIDMDF